MRARLLLAALVLGLAWPALSMGTAQAIMPATLAKAADANPARARADLLARLAKLLEERSQTQSRVKGLEAELTRLKAEGRKARTTVADLQKQEAALKPRLAEAGREARSLQEQLETLRKRYSSRMRVLYLFGADASYSLLGSSVDFNDYIVRSQYLTRLADQDQHRLHELHARARELNRMRVKLSLRRFEMASLREQQAERRDWLAKLHASQQDLLQKLNQQVMADSVTIAALREAEARLARTFALDQLPPPGPLPSQRAAPPVEGRMLGRTGTAKRGVLMKARQGNRVRTPWAGVVAYAAPLEGYGRVVIVDHGNRMHTVLAHLGRLSVESGQKVKAGQVVGAVGSGARLYLEVRRGAKAMDPVSLLGLDP